MERNSRIVRKKDGALELAKDSAMDDEYNEDAMSFLAKYLNRRSKKRMDD